MAQQLELFGPCIMGRRSKTEAERLEACEQKAAALGLRIEEMTYCGLLPDGYTLVCDGGQDDGRFAVVDASLARIEQALAIVESEPAYDKPRGCASRTYRQLRVAEAILEAA